MSWSYNKLAYIKGEDCKCFACKHRLIEYLPDGIYDVVLHGATLSAIMIVDTEGREHFFNQFVLQLDMDSEIKI